MNDNQTLLEFLLKQIAAGRIPEDEAREFLLRAIAGGVLDGEPAAGQPAISHTAAGQPAAGQPDGRPSGAGQGDAVAVVGMACHVPGASSLPGFWALLTAGADAVGPAPAARVRLDPSLAAGAGGYVDGIDLFDPGPFGLSARQAELLAPEHRLFLRTVWHGLEDAGYLGRGPRDVGVFVGSRSSRYVQDAAALLAGEDSGREEYRYLLQSKQNYIAAWIPQVFDYTGPAIVVDTACSSSLVSVHLACRSLLAGECSMAIAGGVDVLLDPRDHAALNAAGALSPGDRCRTFDASADGYVAGEGAGAVLLKRLDRAVEDGDRIYGVIRDSAVNNDGRTMGVTTPSVQAQRELISAALRSSGVRPREIGYVEAHGTGTAIGDPIELRALADAYAAAGGTDHCFVGSVKTNVGHLHSAAGIASLIKVMLCLHHRTLVPSLHFDQPNPRVGWESLPFEVVGGTRPWAPESGPLRAGISAFGFGGTNCHLIVEQAPAAEPVRGHRPGLLALSAPGQAELRERARSLAAHLRESSGWTPAEVAATVNIGRGRHGDRLALEYGADEFLPDLLDHWLSGGESEKDGPWYREGSGARPPGVAFVYAGQGGQYPGMGRTLYQNVGVYRRHFDECAQILAEYLREPVGAMMSREADAGYIRETVHLQPFVFAMEYALTATLGEMGVRPGAVIGHSVGEYAAAVTAGLLDLPDAARLVAERARLMDEHCPRGAMSSVFAPADRVRERLAALPQVEIGALNGPVNTVISGPADDVRQVTSALRADGIRSVDLRVSHAFHSPLMEPMAASFRAVLDSVTHRPGGLPFVSTLHAELLDRAGTDYWLRQIREPVRFADGLRKLRDLGCRYFVEIGPGATFSGVAAATLGTSDGLAYASLLRNGQDDLSVFLRALGGLHAEGIPVDLGVLDQPANRRRLSIPGLPLQRASYWAAPAVSPAQAVPTEQAAPPDQAAPPGRAGRRAAPGGYYTDEVDRTAGHWSARRTMRFDEPALRDHTVLGTAVLPGVSWLEMLMETLPPADGDSATTISNISFVSPLRTRPGEVRRAGLEIERQDENTFRFTGHSTGTGGEQPPEQHVIGTVSRGAPARPRAPRHEVGELLRRCPAEVEPDEIYRRLRQAGIAHGPYYTSITSVRAGAEDAVATLELTDTAIRHAGPLVLHPALIDAATTAGMAMESAADSWGAGKETAYVPYHIASITAHEPLGRSCLCHYRRVCETADLTTFDIDVISTSGRLLVAIRGFTSRRIPAGASSFAGEAVTVLAPRTRAAAHSPASAPSGVRLVFADRLGIADRLRAQPTERECQVVEVLAGERYEWLGPATAVLGAGRPEDYQRLLAEVLDAKGRIGQIVYGRFCGLRGPQAPSAEAAGARAESAVRHLLCLIQAVGAAGIADETELRILVDPVTTTAPEGAVLAGILRTLRWEYPRLSAQLLTVAGDDPASVRTAAEELRSRPDRRELEITGESRHEREWRAIRLDDAPPPGPGTFVITGGLGGIGRRLAAALLSVPGNRVALLQRRDGDDADLTDLSGLPGQVMVVRADVTGRQSMTDALTRVRERFGPVTGVLHAAGVLRDGLIQGMYPDQVGRVLAPKVAGTLLLLELTAGDPIEHFVLFSSVAGVRGGLGQAEYAAANAFLDMCADHAPTLGVPVKSVAWPLWADTGMGAAAAAADNLRRLGGSALDPDEAVRTLLSVLRHPGSRFLVETGRPVEPPAARIEPPASGAGQNEAAAPAARATPQPPSGTVSGLRDQVLRLVANQVGRAAESLDTDTEFLELGLDSVQVIEFAGAVSDAFGIQLYPTALFEYPTIDELVAHLRDAFPEAVARLAEPSPAPAAPTVRPEPAEPLPVPAAPAVAPEPVAARAEERPAGPPADGGPAVAVIGYAGRFPGAGNTDELWSLLRAGRNAVAELDASDLGRQEGREALYAGLVDRADEFDPLSFRIPPHLAAAIDPQQRLVLEVVRDALEIAGVASSAAGSRTSVHLGVMNLEYQREATRTGVSLGVGTGPDMVANRVSHTFDLHGPSVAVSTACSSSLVAVHLACEALRTGEADMALAGGVNVLACVDIFDEYLDAGLLSPRGRCFTFDQSADGYARSEGAGIVVLKPLAAALRDGDTVHGVIHGSAVGHDGRTNGIGAPSARAQAAVVSRALQAAGLGPELIGYVEAHGTGTALGDPIELQGLTQAFEAAGLPPGSVPVGSLKSNIGHMEAAAGIGSLIKVLLCLRHSHLPPTIGCTVPNPLIKLDAIPFAPLLQGRAWPAEPGRRRVAGISSFGFGGMGAHLVIAEPPPRAPSAAVAGRPVHVAVISGRTAQALHETARDLRRALAADEDLPVADVCYSLAAGRTHEHHRAGFVVRSSAELAARLAGFCAGTDPADAEGEARPRSRLGLGLLLADAAGDLGPLLTGVPAMRAALGRWDEALAGAGLPPSQEVLSAGHCPQWLHVVVGCALAELWRSWGDEPVAIGGTGPGAIAAAWAAGVLGRSDVAAILSRAVGGRGAPRGTEPAGRPGRVTCCSPEGPLGPACLDDWLAVLDREGGLSLAEDRLRELGARDVVVLGGAPAGQHAGRVEDEGSAWWRSALGNLLRLHVTGYPVDWAALEHGRSPRRLPLPPTARPAQSYWALPTPRLRPSRPAAVSAPTWKQIDTTGETDRRLAGTWLLLGGPPEVSGMLADRLHGAGARIAATPPDGDGYLEVLKDTPDLAGVCDLRGCEDPRASTVRASTEMPHGPAGPSRLLSEFQSLLSALVRTRRGDCEVWVAGTGLTSAGPSVRPDKAAVVALARVADQEEPGLRFRVIDADWADGPAECAAAFARRLISNDDRFLVAHRRGRRLEPAQRPLLLTPSAVPEQATGVWWITGGLGDLGIRAARVLAARGARTLVLTGRTGLPERSSWNRLAGADAGAGARIARVLELERAGCEVVVQPADLADRAAVQAVADHLGAVYGDIQGVVHAAGVPGDGRLLRRQEEVQRAEAFVTKVHGVHHLYQATRPLRPRHFVLFSSAAATDGGIGFGDYAAANAYLDAFAATLRESGAQVLSIGWDAWEGQGMAARLDGNPWVAGHPRLSDQAGDWAMEQTLLLRGESALAVRARSGPARPAGEPAAPPSSPPVPDLVPDDLLGQVRQVVADAIDAPAADVHPGLSLFELAVDSRTRMQILFELEERFGREIPTTLLNSDQDLTAIASYLAGGPH